MSPDTNLQALVRWSKDEALGQLLSDQPTSWWVFYLGGFIPTCHAQTCVEIAKLEMSMKTNEFLFYRKRIGQTQEKIAEVLSIPLDVYIEIEEDRREASARLKDAFYDLLARYPGSSDLSRLKIKAIDSYKADYLKQNGVFPVGKHWIPFSFSTSKKALVDFSPLEEDVS